MCRQKKENQQTRYFLKKSRNGQLDPTLLGVISDCITLFSLCYVVIVTFTIFKPFAYSRKKKLIEEAILLGAKDRTAWSAPTLEALTT